MNSDDADSLPRSVAWLGYGGLLPFMAPLALVFIDPGHASLWREALTTYGAVILSFVGALHWGFAMTLTDLPPEARQQRFLWSVVPALLALSALLLPLPWGTGLLIAGFAAHYWQDVGLAGRSTLPGWYLPLRLRLTSVACACLALGALG